MLIVAIVVFEELQTTEVVMSPAVPLLYVPTARNCWVAPIPIVELAGVAVIETKEVTVKLVSEAAVEPPSVTEIGPVVALGGTVTVKLFAVAAVTVAAVPLN